MSDDRDAAAKELREWRILYKCALSGTEATDALSLERSLRNDILPEGDAPGLRHSNYPLEEDEGG